MTAKRPNEIAASRLKQQSFLKCLNVAFSPKVSMRQKRSNRLKIPEQHVQVVCTNWYGWGVGVRLRSSRALCIQLPSKSESPGRVELIWHVFKMAACGHRIHDAQPASRAALSGNEATSGLHCIM